MKGSLWHQQCKNCDSVTHRGMYRQARHRFRSERTTSKYTKGLGVWGFCCCWFKNKDPNKQEQANIHSCMYSSLPTHTSVFSGLLNNSSWDTFSFLKCQCSLQRVLHLTCLCSLCFVTVPPLAAEIQNCSPPSGFDLLVFAFVLPGTGWDLLQRAKVLSRI